MKWLKGFLIGLIAAILGIFGLSLLTRDDKEKLEQAKDHIKKAGENIVPEHFNNADSAAHYIDDVLSSLSRRK